MKRLGNRFTAIALLVAICVMNTSTAFAAEEEKENKGFWSSVGGWFVDRGSDIGNAVTVATDATGKWFVDRGKDICHVTEVAGGWVGDRANEICVLATDTGELLVCAISDFDYSQLANIEYYLDSGEKIILGDYSDKDSTALSIGGNLIASVMNVDLGMDIRDLIYDVQYYGSGEVELSKLAIDAVAVLPIIGVVKYVDTAADGIKLLAGTADAASDAARSVDTVLDVTDITHDSLNVLDGVSDTVKASDIVDDAVDAGKQIGKITFEELPEKVQENYKRYVDCGWDGKKALEGMAEGTDAGRTFKNIDEDLPMTDDMGNNLFYTEYDAYQKGDDPIIYEEYPEGRGPGRLVRDSLGNVYFSENHYETFTLITDAIEG